MRRYLIATGGLLAAGLLAAGCSGQPTPPSGNAHQTQPSTSTVAPGRVVAAAYAKTTGARTAKTHLTAHVSVPTGGGQKRVAITASGVIDFASQAADLTAMLPGGAGSIETRYLHGMLYEHLPAAAAKQIPGGKPWISLDVNKIAKQKLGASIQQLQANTPADPSNTLGYLRGVGDKVRELGPATVTGVPTTGYAVTLNLDKATAGKGAAVQQATRKLEQKLGTHTLPAKIWIDTHGRLRKMTITETLAHPPTPPGGTNGASAAPRGPITTTLTETFSAFGTSVHITPPPAGQTTDLTSQVTGGH